MKRRTKKTKTKKSTTGANVAPAYNGVLTSSQAAHERRELEKMVERWNSKKDGVYTVLLEPHEDPRLVMPLYEVNERLGTSVADLIRFLGSEYFDAPAVRDVLTHYRLSEKVSDSMLERELREGLRGRGAPVPESLAEEIFQIF